MFDDANGTVQQLDFPFTLAPSGGGLCLLLQEEARNAYAILVGYTPSLAAPDRQEAIGLVTVERVVQAVFGYPNEEAYWKDPRGDLGHGICEILGSRWEERIDEYNRRTFGTRYPSRPRSSEDRPRHFFIGSKDASAQLLAYGIELEVFPGASFTDVRAEALARQGS